MNAPRILLADDHRMVGEGLKKLLSSEFDVVGLVEDGLALIDAAKKLDPDIILADISMPRLDGLKALVQLKKDNPRVKVVLLTMHQDAVFARRAWEAGAVGYVVKCAAAAELATAIRAVLDGKKYFAPNLTGGNLSDEIQVGRPVCEEPRRFKE